MFKCFCASKLLLPIDLNYYCKYYLLIYRIMFLVEIRVLFFFGCFFLKFQANLSTFLFKAKTMFTKLFFDVD